MKQAINDKINLFIANVHTVKTGFKWQDDAMKRLAALLYTLENKHVDCVDIIESHAIIKGNTGLFSMFKGNMMLCIASMLSLHDNREQLFSNTMITYEQLKTVKFRASDYLTVAALLIASNTEPKNYQITVERAKAFYDGMKKQRWFHTGEDDYIFAAMLGLSEIDPLAGAERIEQLYRMLKPEFRAGGNSLQALCQLLILSGKTDEAIEHLLALRNIFQGHKIKLDKMYTLPALGVLSLLPIDGNTLANDILDVQSYLRTQKGFGAFSVTTQELLLFSSAIISSVYAEDIKNNIISSISTSIASIIIAQQVAVIVAISASSAVAAASSSSQ